MEIHNTLKNKIYFNKYDLAGDYHWRQLEKNIFKYNAILAARYKVTEIILLDIIQNYYDNKNLYALDVGCGDGYLITILEKLGCNSIGIDSNPKAVELAKKKIKDLGFRSHIIKGSCYNLSNLFDDKDTFDIIISTDVIEHLEYPDKFLHECYQVLKEKGTLILSTPLKQYNWVWDRIHYQEFTEDSLKTLLLHYFSYVDIILTQDFRKSKLYKKNILSLPLYKWYFNLISIYYKNPFVKYQPSSNAGQIFAICKKL